MRNLIIGAATAAALLGAPVAAQAATATAPSPWMPVTDPTGSTSTVTNAPNNVPAGDSCAFGVTVAVVTNNEFQQVTNPDDKTTVIRIKGNLVLSFTNDTTGKTLDENVSGPSTETVHSDGSGTFQGEGPSWFLFGPVSKANTGEPGLVFTKGLVTITFSGNTTQAFSLNGTQQNGCALLS